MAACINAAHCLCRQSFTMPALHSSQHAATRNTLPVSNVVLPPPAAAPPTSPCPLRHATTTTASTCVASLPPSDRDEGAGSGMSKHQAVIALKHRSLPRFLPLFPFLPRSEERPVPDLCQFLRILQPYPIGRQG